MTDRVVGDDDDPTDRRGAGLRVEPLLSFDFNPSSYILFPVSSTINLR